ncbi:hypothetical protein EV363DRAFT_1339934 [Boletus edulis]|nr:hypothetical protein EV363DRAFT_1339934 [Boletus edulis]
MTWLLQIGWNSVVLPSTNASISAVVFVHDLHFSSHSFPSIMFTFFYRPGADLFCTPFQEKQLTSPSDFYEVYHWLASHRLLARDHSEA